MLKSIKSFYDRIIVLWFLKNAEYCTENRATIPEF